MTYKENKCIIRDSAEIRSSLNKMIAAKGLFKRAITVDAKANGLTFSEASLCRYLKHGNVKGCITAFDIQWLCNRYKIKLKLKVKAKKIDDDNI